MSTKPFVNLDDVAFDDVEANGYYTSRRACFSTSIGARQLGYNLTELPPGKAQCPFHSHRAEEEMFLILEGEGELRFGTERFPIRKHDVIACPTGGAEVAHQIINTGTSPMRYLSLSTAADVEVCEYPDSGKIGVFASSPGAPRLRELHRSASAVDYYDGESTQPPGRDA
ncbi:cupin domain-containing protein [Piscinibacter defluvii]|uniref:cupin domain-containing protein n=1 Tax=Piscinibacter defluvii TaxID=1796922 RepID=UPI000FDE2104|nr:cupin domain-containing protein [Piscinibacter defluvii]